jgi:hypothetical protein
MECGTARIEITPPFATALFGYPTDDRTYSPHKDKVLDPLQARALYLQNSSSPGILLITLDLCILLTADAVAYRKTLSEELRLPVENILISCTHTHSAPLARYAVNGSPKEPTDNFIADPLATSVRYGKWLLGRLRKIATMAVARKSPVAVSYRETFTGLGFNRRCPGTEGIRNCWNLAEFPDRTPVPMEKLRHAVINFQYQNKQGGVVLQNLGIHPVVMGKENHQISGDWPCYARRHMEKRLNACQAVFTLGAGAQVQPWISTQSDPKALRLVGEAIGAEAVIMASTGESLSLPDNALQINTYQIPRTRVEISTFELGRFLVVGVPFELSTTWAEAIIQTLNRPAIFICLCNGWDGYWMSPKEFDEGGYEVEVARSKNVTADHALALLERLKTHAL